MTRDRITADIRASYRRMISDSEITTADKQSVNMSTSSTVTVIHQYNNNAVL